MPSILFTTVGSGSWVKPSGVTRVEIECWGAGGDGNATSPGRRGGGGGSYSSNMSGLTTNYAVTEMVVPYYVADRGSQEDTTWGKNSSAPEWNVYNRVRARAGQNATTASPGAGGSGGDGTTQYAGGSGVAQAGSTVGGGGGAAGENGPGNNAVGSTGGSGSGQFSGNGASNNTVATPYGAGGAGSALVEYRVATQGLIRIQYADPATQFQLNPTDVDFATEAEINPTGDYNLFIKL
jgi:hypothetical protein